jgi:hypothetical protein
MNELTKDQWEKSMSTGFGDGDHPINHENPHHDTLVVSMKENNAEMAMSDMTKVIKYSNDLQKMFNVNDDLEDWVKAKLNHAADYVATVRDYLKFYHDEKSTGTPDNEINEKWSRKYKSSIDCSHPKGFSQKAHCAGRRARRAGRRTKSSSVSEVEIYNEVLKDLVEDILAEDSAMAMGALKQLNHDAQELQSMLKPQMELPDWCKAKLNLAGEYLDDIYHHLDHFGPDGRDLDEISDPNEPEFYKRKKKPTLRIAIPEIAYWVSPTGEAIRVGDHTQWVRNNRDKILGFKADEPYTSAFKNGYVRLVYLPDDNSLRLHNSGEDESYGFYVNGNPRSGTPPVTSAAKDAIRNFIKEKEILVVVDDRGKLRIDEIMNEGWGKTLATAALAAATAFGAPKVQGAAANITTPKPVATSTVQKQAPYTVEDIIAATLVDEAGGEKDSIKGMHAVLNVIMNRAKNNLRQGAIECLKPKQFSGWNTVNKKDANSIKKFIDSKRGHAQFQNALKLVNQAKIGSLKDITKGSNHFLNVQLTKAQRKGGNLPSWYDPKKVVADYGKHRFLKLEEMYELA